MKKELKVSNINHASVERGVDIRVEAGTSVSQKDRTDSAQSVKRSPRIFLRPYDSKTQCFFCGTEVEKIDQNMQKRIVLAM